MKFEEQEEFNYLFEGLNKSSEYYINLYGLLNIKSSFKNNLSKYFEVQWEDSEGNHYQNFDKLYLAIIFFINKRKELGLFPITK